MRPPSLSSLSAAAALFSGQPREKRLPIGLAGYASGLLVGVQIISKGRTVFVQKATAIFI